MTHDDQLRYFGPPYEERFKPGAELDRNLDTTQLKFETFKYQPHKDYLGHVFRWGFASRFVFRGCSVLDVGCGQDLPFLRALGGANPNTVPNLYVGVDLNRVPDVPKRRWAKVYGETNLIKTPTPIRMLHAPFDLVVCFEVYEHVAPPLALPLLRTIASMMNAESKFIFSTPVYCHSFKMAKNHLNERTKAEVEDDLHRTGFKIISQHGTFGNYRDFLKVIDPDEKKRYEECRAFYGDDVMGCYLAPRYPEASRNITHVCVLESSTNPECELKESIL